MDRSDKRLSQALSGLSLSVVPPVNPPTRTTSRRTSTQSPKAIPLPPSSPYNPTRNGSSPVVNRQQTPLRRSASSMSIGRAASSPSPAPGLHRRTSLASLRGASDSPSQSPRLQGRRSTSNLFMGQLAHEVLEEDKEVMTPESIAAQHFAYDLETVHAEGNVDAKTMVVLHDSCYGHRFSRPKYKQADLDLIVERPERIRASAVGVAAAYVRLGERYAGAKHAPHPRREPTASVAPFRILKTSRMVDLEHDAVTAVHGTELMQELKGMCAATEDRLSTVGGEIQRGRDKRAFHTGDLYLCKESMAAFQGALGGVLDAVDAVFSEEQPSPERAFVAIRPPGHHCSSDYPSGFCWINNVHVGIQHAVKQHKLTHAAIIDFDLHHGDGSQEITWGHNEAMFYPDRPMSMSKKSFIGYFSLHDINSFPCEGGDREKVQNASLCVENAHGQSIWNVHLKPWKTVADFWALYETQYLTLIEKMRLFLRLQSEDRLRAKGAQQKPKAAIFISAGFDASEHEGGGMQRHSVNVPTEFYARFTRDIVKLAQEPETHVEGRVISVLEGGYSNRALMSGVLSHIGGLCHEEEEFDSVQINGNASQALGLSGLAARLGPNRDLERRYNAEWWHPSNLETMDAILEPHPSVAIATAAKKARTNTFYTPTHASTLKARDPSKVYRGSRSPSVAASRPPSPPPPDVDWVTATAELSNLLIPSDRETRSLTAARLTESKVKKERGPVPVMQPPPPEANNGGRTLRDRKPKVEVKTTAQRKASTDRRKTIAESPLLKADMIRDRPNRRMSVASTVSATSAAGLVPQAAKPRATTAVPGGLDVKKQRATVVGAVRSTSAAPSRPTMTKAASNGAIKREIKKPAVEVSLPGSRRTSVAPTKDPMDDLTSGLKRITIKVPSQEEYDSRQKKTVAARKTTSILSSRPSKPAVPKPSATKKPATKSKSATPVSATPTPSDILPSIEFPPTGTETFARQNSQLVLPPAEPHLDPVSNAQVVSPVILPSAGISSEARPPNGLASTSVIPNQAHPGQLGTTGFGYQQGTHYSHPNHLPQQPNGIGYPQLQWMPTSGGQPPANHAVPDVNGNEYQQLQWLPPNTDPALPKQAAEPAQQQRLQPYLPAFSATGFIPFQAPGGHQGGN